MNLLIDTNILIEIENGNKKIIDELEKIKFNKLYISSLTISEFVDGSLKCSTAEQEKTLNALKKYPVLNTTLSSSILLAHFSHVLTKKGRKIPLYDLVIASIAVDNDAILLTMDNHFKRIPGLEVIFTQSK
ncbi:type II toxin-antitoxin system VapC family toxin [Candidatus Woesearchaeota archaeon]|nr:type II toxin-antitoxin system VapC family toxin [Candidatus Woesearchaeota archaeon]